MKKAPKKKAAKKRAKKARRQRPMVPSRAVPITETPVDSDLVLRVRGEDRPPACTRMVRHDSLGWTCACGATGPVGRSQDGIPFVTADILEHETGESKWPT